MNNIKPMKIIMLEDNKFEVNRYKNYINTREDVNLVASFNSCMDTINYIKTTKIEGIIVDIELNEGLGQSGLKFLEDLNLLNLENKPIIIITTNIKSERVYEKAHQLGAEMIFNKGKKDYTPELVINEFISLRETPLHDTPISIINETNFTAEEDRIKWIKDKIESELNKIGISHTMSGREYILDAIYYLVETKEDPMNQSFQNYLKNKYTKHPSTINQAIQRTIDKAWRTMPYEELAKYFTPNVIYNNGSPLPSEFLYFYADKVKKFINSK